MTTTPDGGFGIYVHLALLRGRAPIATSIPTSGISRSTRTALLRPSSGSWRILPPGRQTGRCSRSSLAAARRR